MKHSKWEKRALLAAISGTLLLGASGQALAVDKALIVGVGKFQLSQANLPGIDLDVNMAKDIAAYMGIRQENIHVVMDEQATYSRVRDEMKSWLGQGVSSDDRVFIYFSSHGTLVEDKDGDEPDGNSVAIVLHDIDGKTQQGLYNDDDFGSDLKNISSQNIVVMTEKAGFTKSGECNCLELAAAQKYQHAISTNKGSLFTVAFLDSFAAAHEKSDPPTLKDIYQMTENKLKESGVVDFQPNMSGNMGIADRPIRGSQN